VGYVREGEYFNLLPKGSEKSGFLFFYVLDSILSLIIDTRTGLTGSKIHTPLKFPTISVTIPVSHIIGKGEK
jgi:hypothetical protein